MIVDYKGRIVGRHDYSGGSSYVAGTIDIEALRDHRTRARRDNWMKDLRTEVYQTIYEQPIHPKNLYLDRAPYNHAEFRREVITARSRIWLSAKSGFGRLGMEPQNRDSEKRKRDDMPQLPEVGNDKNDAVEASRFCCSA